MEKKKIAIFASGSGSNAMKLIEFFHDSQIIDVALILTNNQDAGILKKSAGLVEQVVISNEEASNGILLKEIMDAHKIDYIVLAGYLRKIPDELIDAFPDRIINIHPALLPKYGGKGMYGMNVHEAVFENRETKSGITIHLVNNQYDKGRILVQVETALTQKDSPQDIRQKVLKIEHQYFPKVVNEYIQARIIDEIIL